MATGAARGPARRGRRALAGLVVLAAAYALAWWIAAGRHPRAPVAPAALTARAIGDSLAAARKAGRTDLVLRWVERDRAMAPDVPRAIIDHAMALHNAAWGGTYDGRSRTATRTSLDRVEVDLRVIAMLDSAAASPRALAADRARAERLAGLAFENYGLPVDALMVELSAFRSALDDTLLAGRINFLTASLRDPLGPRP